MAYFETINLADATLLYSGVIAGKYTNVTLTNGSSTISGLTGMSSSNIGQSLAPIAGFPVGTSIISINSSSSVQVSFPFSGITTSTGVIILQPIIGSSIDTTGSQSIIIQIAGLFSGAIYIEGSNDNINWDKLLVLPLNDVSLTDVLLNSGNYSLKTSTKFIRYNAQYINSDTPTLTIYSRSGVGPSASDTLSLALDVRNNTPLNVSITPGQSGTKQDASGALILSDAPNAVTVNAVIGTTTIIDTQGYQSLDITTSSTFAASNGIQLSNDGLIWSTVAQIMLWGNPPTVITGFAGSQTCTHTVVSRFVRIICTTAGSFTYQLRNIPGALSNQNIAAIGGITVSSTTAQLGMNLVQLGGTAPVAVGAAAAGPPIPIGMADIGGFVRRSLSDINGRTLINAFNINNPTSTAPSSTITAAMQNNPAYVVGSILNTVQGTAALNVQDTAQFEQSSGLAELLGLILLELRIANQQRYEMVQQLNTGVIAMDQPENFRSDTFSTSSLFLQ